MIDLAHLQQWIGRTELIVDRANPAAARGLLATLDRVDLLTVANVDMPLTAHWLHFHQAAAHSELGPDGHPQRGGFLPPVPLPRRMWAGSRLRFARRMRAGETIEKRSTVTDVRATEGRSGKLAFVTVRHEIGGDNGAVLIEEQDIVYRELAPAGSATRPSRRAEHTPRWRRQVTPDPVMLFRYSALTFNGHRIHYDHPYVTQVEGYAGLVVHGPLIATLLLDLLERERPQAIVQEFSFRAVAPLFDTAPFFICGAEEEAGKAVLWAENESGELSMEATATLEADT
jgi:3-methylfumaryl-CoA hydratase